jgi:hypothetical protein
MSPISKILPIVYKLKFFKLQPEDDFIKKPKYVADLIISAEIVGSNPTGGMDICLL